MTNCLILNNEANRGGGTGIDDSDADQYNCTIVGNHATYKGGAGYTYGSFDDEIVNCIVWGNSSDYDNDAYYGSPVMTYTCIQDGWPGDSNFDEDPLFESGPDGAYYLDFDAGSPCVDSGSDLSSAICYTGIKGTVCMNQLTTRTDTALDTSTVDMGYHYKIPPPTNTPVPTQTPPQPPTSTPTQTPTDTPTQHPTPITGTLLGQVYLERPGVPSPDDSWIVPLTIAVCRGGNVYETYPATTSSKFF